MPVLEVLKSLFIQKLSKRVMYSSAICSDCQEAEKFFTEQGVEIEVKKIEDPAHRQELKEKHGKVLVPTIILGGEKFIGFAQNREAITRKLGLDNKDN